MTANHAFNGVAHELQGGQFKRVLAVRKLVHVAVKVLGAHVVIDAVVAALEERPEAFNTVRMRHSLTYLPTL